MPSIAWNAQSWFFFPSFSLSFYLPTVTAEGCQELGGVDGVGGSWDDANAPIHIKGNIIKVSHLSCMETERNASHSENHAPQRRKQSAA